MILARLIPAALVIALAACATAPDPAADPHYFVTRHLQKAEGNDPGLTEQGRSCAVRLAERLDDQGIRTIYVSTTRRARETAAALATRLGLAPATYDPANTPALVARLRSERGGVLVVGHSNTVPDIVAQLGGERPAPIADDRYGDLWRISGSPQGTTHSRLAGC